MPKATTRTLSVADLLAEIKRRQRKLPKLRKLAAKFEQKLAAVKSEIAGLGGRLTSVKRVATATRRGARKRPHNKLTLADAIAKVLDPKKAKSVPQIAADVQKAGYRSTSKTFTTIIYQTLAKDKRVKKIGRGLYGLKG